MIKDIQLVQNKLEIEFLLKQDSIEQKALKLYESDKNKLIEYLTNYSVKQGEKAVDQWRELGFFLITKYNDGYVKDKNNKIESKGYPDKWNRRVIKTEGEKHKIKNAKNENEVKSF